MSDFYEDLKAIRVHQIASGSLQNLFLIKSSKKIFRDFRFFSLEFKCFYLKYLKIVFFKGATPSHDDYGKT
jgi:hypothetical protein